MKVFNAAVGSDVGEGKGCMWTGLVRTVVIGCFVGIDLGIVEGIELNGFEVGDRLGKEKGCRVGW